MAARDTFSFDSNLGGSGEAIEQTGGEVTGDGGIRSEDRQDNGEAGQSAASADFDPAAPFGRFADGTPRKRRFAKRNRGGQREAGQGADPEAFARKPGKKNEKLAVEFKLNNRDTVLNNIQGMHAAAAALTKQPVLLLTPPEAKALTDSLCNVLDYHRINITEVTGPWGLYVALGLTAFAIYKPRLAAIKAGNGQQIEQPTAPSTPAEAEYRAAGFKPMDFTGDVNIHAETMQ